MNRDKVLFYDTLERKTNDCLKTAKVNAHTPETADIFFGIAVSVNNIRQIN